MTEDEFWVIVQRVRAAAPAKPNGIYETLKTGLGELPLAEIQSFKRHFSENLIRAYSYDLWGAAFIIGGSCGDDMFWDFRSTLIMQGKDFFEAALVNPDSLAEADYSEENENNYPFYENYGYVAEILIEARGGEVPCIPLPDEPSGYRWKEEELPRLYPKLTAKFPD